MAVILITHDLGVVAENADEVRSCTRGGSSSRATLDEIFYDPQHPYTWGLLGSLPGSTAARRAAACRSRASRRP